MADKIAAFNPALIVDDVIDTYMEYTYAKKSMERDRIRKAKALKKPAAPPKEDLPYVKAASMERIIEPMVEKVLDNPKLLLPSAKTVALTAAGVASSMYGPEWTGGPTEEDIANKKRFSPKRAMTAILGYNTVGRALSNVPLSAYRSVTATSTAEAISHAASALPGVTAGATIGIALHKGEQPDRKRVMKNYGKASLVGDVVSVGAGIYSSGLIDAIREASQAAAAARK